VDNGWQLFLDGLSAQRDLNFALALDKYQKCDKEPDFIDPICIVSESDMEVKLGSMGAAKSDIAWAAQRYPGNHAVITEGIYISVLDGDLDIARDLHAKLLATPRQNTDDSVDCLYYYGLNQPKIAAQYCSAMLRKNTSTSDYTPWSNSGYVALDNGNFKEAAADFSSARKIYDASKEKHTVTQELDLSWGLVLSAYYAGDKKDAESLYRDIQRTYPDFSSISGLKQLPLIWSDNTQSLITTMMQQIK
jgi:tetratricopeptide (TPR) repeat protein